MSGSGSGTTHVSAESGHSFFSRIYKIPDGKPENTFAFSGEAKNKKYATEIIHECHEAWRRLIGLSAPSADLGDGKTLGEKFGISTYVSHENFV